MLLTQRLILIFGTLGYFKLAALPEGRCGRSHIFKLPLRFCFKIF